MSSGLVWQGVLGLTAFAAAMFFAASETALVSLSRSRLKKLLARRPAAATALVEWLRSPHYLLTTILVGNTFSQVVSTIVATNLAIAWFPTISHGAVETGTWLAMILLLFVFGELVPKSLARHYPERITLASLRWIHGLDRLLAPLLRRALALFERHFRAFEGVPVGRLSVYTVEEIREMISAGAAQGSVPHRSRQMMERALALSQKPIAQIMTPFEKIEAVNLGQDQERILDQVAEMGRTRVPCYRVNPRKIGGYLHVKDLLLVWRGALPLRIDALLRPPIFVGPQAKAAEVLEEFRKGKSHLAVIVDGQGDCQGIVTLEDVLEEIVGEILDEYDLENPRGIR